MTPEALTDIGPALNGSTGAVRSSATTSVSHAGDGTVTATALSDSYAFTIPGVLSVGEVRTTATVVRDPSAGGLHRKTSMSIGKLSAGGVTVDVEGGQLIAGGNPVPSPFQEIAALVGPLSGGQVSLSLEAQRNTPKRRHRPHGGGDTEGPRASPAASTCRWGHEPHTACDRLCLYTSIASLRVHDVS